MSMVEQLQAAIASASSTEEEKQTALALLKRIEKSMTKLQFSYDAQLESSQRLTLLLRATSEDLTIALKEGEARSAELERLDAEKNEFLGIAAHDLKNPLAAITLWAEMLLRYGPALSPEQVAEKLQSIKQSAHRMSTLISNLLDINMIESSGLQLEPVVVDVGGLVRSHCHDYRDVASVKDITIESRIELPVHDAKAVADHRYCGQILSNLLSNAVKYSPIGSTVRVCVERRMELPHATGCWLVTSVTDNGPGLAEWELESLFKKFARLSAKPTGGESSTGLGLSIVKRLAEAMGGSVWCDSVLGEGSTFSFALPSHQQRGCK